MFIKCRSCGAQIIFIKTKRGRAIPCDIRPVRFDYEANGPAQIVTEDGDVIRGRISRDGADIGYISHFATCPNAAAHRRNK